VGKKNSRAMYHLNDSDDVSFLLAKFVWAIGNAKEQSSNVLRSSLESSQQQ